jgi:drug/metabolite transporter (DMT)-like permease
MLNYYFPFGLAVGGGVLYHLAQKSIPKGMSPFVATIFAYAIGIFLCAICAVIYPSGKSLMDSVKESNWAVLGLGFGVAAIELGFLLAYRAGWKIGITTIATNVAITVVLIPVGFVVFKDQLSPRNLVGLAFCILGLILVVRD